MRQGDGLDLRPSGLEQLQGAVERGDDAVVVALAAVELGAILSFGDPADDGVRVRVTGVRNPCPTFARGVGRADWVEVFSERNRVGVYLAVLAGGVIQAGDEVRVISSPGHRVTCRRWFAHHDPRDAQGLLNSEIFGNCVIAPFTKKYVNAAAHEQVG